MQQHVTLPTGSWVATVEGIDLKTARARAATLLGEATQPTTAPGLIDVDGGGPGEHSFMQGKTPSGLGESGLLYFGLTQLLDLTECERGDKVAWSIRFEFRGRHFAFELRKFGLRLRSDDGERGDPLLREVHWRARALARIAARHLASVHVPAQLQAGTVTIPNYFDALEWRYRFFRDQAEALFASLPVLTAANVLEVDLSAYNETSSRAGAFATSCIDAYLSRVDHLFVLSLAFTGDVVERGGLLEFLGASWSKKFCEQLKPGDDPRIAKLYEELVTLRREWRNPWAHGGLKSGGASFYFHAPGVGALPVSLSKSEGRQIMDLETPERNFNRALELFDEFDEVLEHDKLRYTYRWARSGLDLPVDAGTRQQARDAMRSPEDFEDFVEGVGRHRDMVDNVEY